MSSLLKFAGKTSLVRTMATAQNRLISPVTDINEKELEKIGETHKIKNLSPAHFSSIPFPAQGYIHNNRMMIPLICQLDKGPSVNIWFMVITGVPFTSITRKSLKALGGSKKDQFLLTIQDDKSQIKCGISTNDHEEINVLGTGAMCSLMVSPMINFNAKDFRFVRN